MDDSYQDYVNRVAPQTLVSAYENQLTNAQASPKFQQRQVVPFAGFSLVTPTAADDPTNGEFYRQLTTVQQEVVRILDPCFIPLPTPSLHLTVADLIWDGHYEDLRRQNPDFEQLLCNHIQHSFADYRIQQGEFPACQWQVLGLFVLPRSLGVALVPRREADYVPLFDLRRMVYQDSDLIALGIEQQYRYTAHITLGYFDAAIETLPDVAGVSHQLAAINDQWLGADPLTLEVITVQLRHFTDMAHFIYAPHYPSLSSAIAAST